MKKQSKVSIISILCVSILIFGISMFSSMRLNATTVSYDPPSYSSLTPHDPISIFSDLGLEVFPGSGTVEDPYTIEGYNITTTSDEGIFIADTTKYFVIRNCYVDASHHGIYIDGVADDTATIINNTCSNNDWGIVLEYSGSSTVANNTFTNCGLFIIDNTIDAYISYTIENNLVNGKKLGFYTNLDSTIVAETVYGQLIIVNSTNVTVRDQILNNASIGLFLYSCTSSVIINNTCNNNNHGIFLSSSGSSTVTNNTCNNNNNGAGIYLHDSDYFTFKNNICSKNQIGIFFDTSDFCDVTYNLLQENEGYSVYLFSGSDNNLFHHNNFIDNYLGGTSQAYDDGDNNYWYDNSINEGNYWDDWDGEGNYAIDGTASSVDFYPFDEPMDIYPPNIFDIIHSPSTPTELDTISINATVTDDSGIYNVTLHYKIDIGLWQTISMTFVSGDIYSVTIGPYSAGTTIEYYVSAIDNSANHNEAIEDNGGLYYTILVGDSDVTGPTIDNIIHSPTTPTELDSIIINATVTDDSTIHNVTLLFRINSGTWTEVSMTLISGDLYSVTIGSFTSSDTIEYYITAIDNSLNHNEATEDNSGLYYSFTVSVVISEFQMFSLLLPAITFLFLVCGLVVLQRRKK